MSKTSPDEADARAAIDELLRASGWVPEDQAQLVTEYTIPFVPRGDGVAERVGRADYVMLDAAGAPLAVVEAKRAAIDPYVAREQALAYAKAIDAPYIFLSNGEQTYFWDYARDDARSVVGFYSRRDLVRVRQLRAIRQPLASIERPKTYVKEAETRVVRPYQRDAMRGIDEAIDKGKRRFLLELPTGTGKTDVVALQLKRLFEAGVADRVLFLVDRETLAEQALAAFQDVIAQHPSYWLRPGGDVAEHQITVCLLQTMINRAEEFTAGAFDVVVMDECHRSIYGAWRPAIERFDAIHIGLTATPAEYGERNTFEFYECPKDPITEAWHPHFSYALADAIREGYLTPFHFAQGLTRVIAAGADLEDEHFDPAQFEREWTNEKTNRLMVEEFDRLAWKNAPDLAPGESRAPGKAIVFAITKAHATRLARYLNELHPEDKGDYAAVITADTWDAKSVIRRFKRERRPAVAVSVGMLDTGFDCPDVLHIVLCRPVASPILYQQIRGRGTRRCDRIEKRAFVIYDFFGNIERFGDREDAPVTGGAVGPGSPATANARDARASEPRKVRDLDIDDEWLYRVNYVEVGPDGERVDKREYVREFEAAVHASASANEAVLAMVRAGARLDAAQEDSLAASLNRPRWYFNAENLRLAYGDPRGALVDFVRVALGVAKPRSRDAEIEAAFEAWVVARGFSHEQGVYLRQLCNRARAQGAKLSINDLFEPPLSIWNADVIGESLFGAEGLKAAIDALDAEVLTPSRKAMR